DFPLSPALAPFDKSDECCRNNGNWTDAGQVLIIVRDKGVTEGAEHDKAKQRSQRSDEKKRCHFEATTDAARREIDRDAREQPSYEPTIIQRIVRIDRP